MVCTELMTSVTNNHHGLLLESQWWYDAHICENTNCCCLGIDLNKLKKQNIIEENHLICSFVLIVQYFCFFVLISIGRKGLNEH